MLLIHMHVTSPAVTAPRGVSVWVSTDDSAQAQHLAAEALAAEGWALASIDGCVETSADDYFRPCPSQQAFERARAATVAWRFDDE